MHSNQSNKARVLAIAPSTRGCGFAVLEGAATLVDWGVKTVKGDKNTQCLIEVEKMLARYAPALLVFEDFSAKGSKRSERIRKLGKKLEVLAIREGVKVMKLTREEVRKFFFGDERSNKYSLAKMLAERFPEELGSRLPPKRKAWMSEDYRMGIFDAVALALASRERHE